MFCERWKFYSLSQNAWFSFCMQKKFLIERRSFPIRFLKTSFFRVGNLCVFVHKMLKHLLRDEFLEKLQVRINFRHFTSNFYFPACCVEFCWKKILRLKKNLRLFCKRTKRSEEFALNCHFWSIFAHQRICFRSYTTFL